MNLRNINILAAFLVIVSLTYTSAIISRPRRLLRGRRINAALPAQTRTITHRKGTSPQHLHLRKNKLSKGSTSTLPTFQELYAATAKQSRDSEYSAPAAPSYEDDSVVDLTPTILSFIAISGLILLFPGQTRLDTVKRKKRSSSDEFSTGRLACVSAWFIIVMGKNIDTSAKYFVERFCKDDCMLNFKDMLIFLPPLISMYTYLHFSIYLLCFSFT